MIDDIDLRIQRRQVKNGRKDNHQNIRKRSIRKKSAGCK
jgi:hypothetical protein